MRLSEIDRSESCWRARQLEISGLSFGAASARTSDLGVGHLTVQPEKKNPAATLSDVTCNMTISNETLRTYCCNICLKHFCNIKKLASKHVEILLLPIRWWWAKKSTATYVICRMFHGTFKLHMKYLNKNITTGLNTCNICYIAIPRSTFTTYTWNTCNILLKHLKHVDRTFATMHRNLYVACHGCHPKLLHRPPVRGNICGERRPGARRRPRAPPAMELAWMPSPAVTRAKLAAGLVWCLGARYIADRGIRRLRREESHACRACVRECAPFSSALMSPFSSERLALQSNNLVGQFSPFTDLVRQRFCLSIDRKLMIINT